MAAAFVQSKSATNDASATTLPVTFTSNVAAGNLIVVAVHWGVTASEALTSVTDGLGNTYTEIGNCRRFDASGGDGTGFEITMYYAKNIAGGACTVTANYPAARSFRRIFVMEGSGLDTAAPLDQSTGQAQAAPGTGANAVTSGSVTTVANGEWIVGTTTSDTGANTPSGGTGFTRREAVGFGAIEEQVQAVAGSIAATFTFGAADRAVTSVATFKAAAAATHSLPGLDRRVRRNSLLTRCSGIVVPRLWLPEPGELLPAI